jgi:hypothetical protein
MADTFKGFQDMVPPGVKKPGGRFAEALEKGPKTVETHIVLVTDATTEEDETVFLGFSKAGSITSSSPIVRQWPVDDLPRIGEAFAIQGEPFRIVDLIRGIRIGGPSFVTLIVHQL